MTHPKKQIQPNGRALKKLAYFNPAMLLALIREVMLRNPVVVELALSLRRIAITRRLHALNKRDALYASDLAFQRGLLEDMEQYSRTMRDDNERQRVLLRSQLKQLRGN